MSSLEYQEGWVKGGFGVSYLPEANKPENFQSQPQMYKIAQWTSDASLFRAVPTPSADAWKVYNYLPGTYPTADDVLNNIYQGYANHEALADLDKRYWTAWDEGIAKARADGVNVTWADFIFPDWDPTKDYVQKNRYLSLLLMTDAPSSSRVTCRRPQGAVAEPHRQRSR